MRRFKYSGQAPGETRIARLVSRAQGTEQHVGFLTGWELIYQHHETKETSVARLCCQAHDAGANALWKRDYWD